MGGGEKRDVVETEVVKGVFSWLPSSLICKSPYFSTEFILAPVLDHSEACRQMGLQAFPPPETLISFAFSLYSYNSLHLLPSLYVPRE